MHSEKRIAEETDVCAERRALMDDEVRRVFPNGAWVRTTEEARGLALRKKHHRGRRAQGGDPEA